MIDQILFLLLVGSEKPCICGFSNLYSPYVATIGNVTEDALKKYIQEQYNESKEEDGAAFERQQVTDACDTHPSGVQAVALIGPIPNPQLNWG